MRASIKLMALGGAALVSACGSEPANSGSGVAASAARAKSGWNALDACATLGTATAASISGSAVTSSKITTKLEGSDGMASLSGCTFELANGAKLVLMTREAPVPDASAKAIELARTGGGMMPPASDVPGLGKAGLWNEPGKQLQVFLDERRFITVNYFDAPANADVKAMSIAVARKLL